MKETNWYQYDEVTKILTIGYKQEILKTVNNVKDNYEAERLFIEWYFT